jgi:threonine dehydrogenase-like Zn-dependent dehydrogenase
MKAWQLTEPQKFSAIDLDFPSAPRRGEAKIRTLRMGICGTDISCYHGKFPFFDYPGFQDTNWAWKFWKWEKGLKMLNPAMSVQWNPI